MPTKGKRGGCRKKPQPTGNHTIEYLVHGKWQLYSSYRTKEQRDEILERCWNKPLGKETYRGVS